MNNYYMFLHLILIKRHINNDLQNNVMYWIYGLIYKSLYENQHQGLPLANEAYVDQNFKYGKK